MVDGINGRSGSWRRKNTDDGELKGSGDNFEG